MVILCCDKAGLRGTKGSLKGKYSGRNLDANNDAGYDNIKSNTGKKFVMYLRVFS